MFFHVFAFIDGVGGPEMVLIFLLVLLLYGGKKLPDLARGFGKSMREFKRAAAGVEDEIKRAIDSTPSSDLPPPKPAPRPDTTKAKEAPKEKVLEKAPDDPSDFLS